MLWTESRGRKEKCLWLFLLHCPSAQPISLALFRDACFCARLLIHPMSSPCSGLKYRPPCLRLVCFLCSSSLCWGFLSTLLSWTCSLPPFPSDYLQQSMSRCAGTSVSSSLSLSLSDRSRILLAAFTNAKRLLWASACISLRAARHPCVCEETQPGRQQSKTRRHSEEQTVWKLTLKRDMGWCPRTLRLGMWGQRGAVRRGVRGWRA